MTNHIQNDPMRLQHKSLGIASFVTAIVGVLLFVAAGVWLLRSHFPIFLNDIGWLGAIGLVGIGLAIAGGRCLDKTAEKVSPVLSAIWFSIAALSMCAWSVFIVLPSEILPYLVFAVRGFLFGLVGVVFAAVCRWVLERKPQSTGARVFSYTSFFSYLVLIAAYAWVTIFEHPWTRIFEHPARSPEWPAVLQFKLQDAFVLFGIVFCIGASITLLRRMRVASVRFRSTNSTLR